MRKFFILTIVCASCISSPRESASVQDSLTAQYEDFSEVTPFTIKDDVRDTPITLYGKQKTVKEFLSKFYAPDTYTYHSPEDSVETPGYIVTDVKVLEGNFFMAEDKCEKRSVLLVSRGNFVDQEFYDLLFLSPDGEGLKVTGKEIFDGSQGQTSTIVTIEKDFLSVKKNCNVLKVTSSSEGGDINLHKNEWVEYFVGDENGFHSVLKLQLEETRIQDSDVQDENLDSSSETRELQILGEGSNGLYNIKARFVSKSNAKTIADLEELYVFDGKSYVRK